MPGCTAEHSGTPAANYVHNRGGGGGQREGVAADTFGKERFHAGTLMHRDLHFPWLGEAMYSRPNLSLSRMIARLPSNASNVEMFGNGHRRQELRSS